ncbi:MAG TPA: M3 family metallopeptidase [Burkholderiaceae bacterium]|jgi:peptidyl-dipeptidase Dcp
MKLTLVALATTAVLNLAHAADAADTRSNPLLKPSTLPFQYPAFDQIQDSDFAPAFDQGMREHLAEVDKIANNPAAPTLENTLVALEKSGKLLSRATNVLFNLIATDNNPVRQKLQSDYSARFSAHSDAVSLNPKLFARIDTIYKNRTKLHLDPESLRLVERYHTRFVRAGALLNEEQKTRVRAINSEMAQLSTKFNQNVLAEVNDSAVVVDTVAELAGLTPNQIAGAAAAAKARNLDGKYVIALLNTTGQPAESQLENRALRERLHKASEARGARGNQWDNTAIVARVATLRAEKAALLGYPTHAAYVLDDETAKTPAAVNAMLSQLAPAAVATAKLEAADLQAMIDTEQAAKGQPSFKLEAWDWSFYSEKVRAAKYGFDESQLKPYLELRNVLEKGVFYAAGQLYGLTFKERKDLPLYDPDTLVYDVYNADGSQLAIYIADMYARPSKRGGAWMSSFMSQSKLMGTHPIVAVHLNIPKPPAGQPTLLTWDEVRTAFHESGHALHGMFSNVKYPMFSGTSVPRDFVEFPSQVNEMWADWPSVLAHYAHHYQTGEAMPQALLDKVAAAKKFNQGFMTTEYLSASILDQRWHQLSPTQVPAAADVMGFEARVLHEEGVDFPPVPPRYRTPYFSHIMGGYSAGYYAYIWSEVLDADTVEWIKTHGGLTRANGDRFRATLLSQGGSQDAMKIFKDMVGHGPDITPLLERRGLVLQKKN